MPKKYCFVCQHYCFVIVSYCCFDRTSTFCAAAPTDSGSGSGSGTSGTISTSHHFTCRSHACHNDSHENAPPPPPPPPSSLRPPPSAGAHRGVVGTHPEGVTVAIPATLAWRRPAVGHHVRAAISGSRAGDRAHAHARLQHGLDIIPIPAHGIRIVGSGGTI